MLAPTTPAPMTIASAVFIRRVWTDRSRGSWRRLRPSARRSVARAPQPALRGSRSRPSPPGARSGSTPRSRTPRRRWCRGSGAGRPRATFRGPRWRCGRAPPSRTWRIGRRAPSLRPRAPRACSGPGYLPIQTGQGRRVAGVGVDYAVRFGPCTVDTGMHRGLYGGFERTIEHLPVGVYEHHVFGLQDSVVEAAGGYEDVAVGGAGADVPGGADDQSRGAHAAGDPYYLFSQIVVVQACPHFLAGVGVLDPAVHVEHVAGAPGRTHLGGEEQDRLRDVLGEHVHLQYVSLAIVFFQLLRLYTVGLCPLVPPRRVPDPGAL